MSFLGGVRWADLSSDTQSLSAAPPFCQDLDNELPTPTPPGVALSPRSPALRGQGRKSEGQKNAFDTAEALLMQCDAAAEQSYLNPSCAADLGCSNAGINLHFKEAARLGGTTPMDEDLREAEDLVRTPNVREDVAHGSTDVGLHGSIAISAAEKGRGHASSATNNQRGRGYSTGSGSSCAGFKGLLASTNGGLAVSSGAVACNRKKWAESDKLGRNGSSCSAAVPRQHSGAAQGKKLGHEKVQEPAEPQRSISSSRLPARKSGGGPMRTGDICGKAHCSDLAPATTAHTRQSVCDDENTSPEGGRKSGDVKMTGRRGIVGKNDQSPAVNAGGEGGTNAQADPGPDASDNWRSSPARGRGDQLTTAVPGERAPCSAIVTVSSHPWQLNSHSDASGVCNQGICDQIEQAEQACLRSDGAPHERSPETLVRHNSAQDSHQHRAPLSSEVCMRERREKGGRRRFPLATRMMTPAKRRRPPAGGGAENGSAALLHNSGACDTGRPLPALLDKISASGDIEEVGEDARDVENVPIVKEDSRRARLGPMEHFPASLVGAYSASQAASAGGADTAAAGLEKSSASFSQSQVLNGPPPRKKKRAEAESNKRLSVEDTAVGGVSSQSGVTAAAPRASNGSISESVTFAHASNDDHFSCGGKRRQRGKRDSPCGTSSTITKRGRRRSKAVGNGGTVERTAHEKDSVPRFPASPSKSIESAAGASIACPNLLQVAAQACPVLQLPGACFATPPYIMVPLAAATPLTTVRRSSIGSVVPPAAVHPASVVGSTSDKKKPQHHQHHKSATAVATSRQTTLAAVAQEDDEETEQEWARRAFARMKDIAVGKATEGYKNFIRIVPKDHRRAGDPSTPDPKQRCSKARFQRELLDWRKQLHRYDGCCSTEEYNISLDSSCSGGGAAPEWPNAGVPCSISPSMVQDGHSAEKHCNTSMYKEGKCTVLRSITSAKEVPGPARLFSTPTADVGQHGAGEVAGQVHLDPIEEFNRECERRWL